MPTIDVATLRAQAVEILSAWGFADDAVAAAADGLLYADRHGIDSHGVAMLPVYDRWRGEGRFDVAGTPRVLREGPTSALIDGGQTLGFLPGRTGMEVAIGKARAIGVAAVAVRRSNHFGAAGWYARMAADCGLVGVATTSTFRASVVPTNAAEAMLGTNPIAFAAPGERERPFLLDMATSTVALGKLMSAAYRGERIPEGWALGPDGRPTTDPSLGYSSRLATPLGGTAALSSHKGYGLGAMVEILSTLLGGAAWAVERSDRAVEADPRGDVGHFLLALDPGLFGDAAVFRARIDAFNARLRATRPADPALPVRVAGDPEYAACEHRDREGIPLPETLMASLRGVAQRAGARWLLGG